MQVLTLEGKRQIDFRRIKSNPGNMRVLTLEGTAIHLGLFKKFRRAVSSVAKKVTSNPLTKVAWQAAKLNPMVNMANQGLKIASDVASGKNIMNTLVNNATGFIPGGDLVKQGIKTASDIASGKNVFNSLVNNASGLVPGGDLIKQGINAVSAVARGENVFNAIKDSVTGMIPDELKTAVSIIQNPSVLLKPDNLLKMAANNLLPPEMKNIANVSFKMIQDPKKLLDPSIIADNIIPTHFKNRINELQNLSKEYPNMADSILKTESEKLKKEMNQYLVNESQKQIQKQAEKQEQKKKMVFVKVQFTSPLIIELKKQMKQQEKSKSLLNQEQKNTIVEQTNKISMKKLFNQIRSV